MNRVIHFEIPAKNPQRAARFYRKLFGWRIREWIIPGVKMKKENRYWMITTGPDHKYQTDYASEPGIDGGIVFRRGPAPAANQPINAYTCTTGVASLDKSLAQALKLGGRLVLPRMPVSGIGWLAYCKDTEGNIFGMLQEDKKAGWEPKPAALARVVRHLGD